MGKYIMMLLGVGIMSTMIELISPERWKKYIKIFSGVIICIMIISPLKEIDISEIKGISYTAQELDNTILSNEVYAQLSKRIEDDVKNRIKEQYSVDSEVTVELSTKADGSIMGVGRIRIKTKAPSEPVRKMICREYGADEEQVIINDG